MNTASILAIVLLGALAAALGAVIATMHRETSRLGTEKTAAETARLAAEAEIRAQNETRMRAGTAQAARRASAGA